MTTVPISDILNFFGRHVDTAGWIRKDATMTGDGVMAVEVDFAKSEPRCFKIVSGDAFRTLDKVRIYEVFRTREYLGGRSLFRLFSTLIYTAPEEVLVEVAP